MRKLVLAALGGTALGLAVTTQVAGPLVAQEAERNASVYEQLDLFGDIFERIRAEYVEEVDEGELVEAAINGMLTSLDPHSSYLSPEDAADMRTQTRGEFGGLGIEVTQEDGVVKVVSPMDGTPADAAGILAGDYITAVDGESVLGLTLDDAVDLMRGPVGSEIIITVVREGEDEPFDVSIIRDTIKLNAVRARTEGETIVMRVTTFNEQTFPDLKSGLAEEIEKAGGLDQVNGVVLDLRNNPGGLLDQAIEVSDAFLERGEIVSTRSRKPDESRRYAARPGDIANGLPMVVLINEGSASASEIVAGALKDHKRAVALGVKSFGKGSVQTVIPISGHGAIRLTTARYYTPSGISIQAKGITPDIEVQQAKLEKLDSNINISEASLRGHLSNDQEKGAEKAPVGITLPTKPLEGKVTGKDIPSTEDYQLSRALDLIQALSIYNDRQSPQPAPKPVAAPKLVNPTTGKPSLPTPAKP